MADAGQDRGRQVKRAVPEPKEVTQQTRGQAPPPVKDDAKRSRSRAGDEGRDSSSQRRSSQSTKDPTTGLIKNKSPVRSISNSRKPSGPGVYAPQTTSQTTATAPSSQSGFSFGSPGDAPKPLTRPRSQSGSRRGIVVLPEDPSFDVTSRDNSELIIAYPNIGEPDRIRSMLNHWIRFFDNKQYTLIERYNCPVHPGGHDNVAEWIPASELKKAKAKAKADDDDDDEDEDSDFGDPLGDLSSPQTTTTNSRKKNPISSERDHFIGVREVILLSGTKNILAAPAGQVAVLAKYINDKRNLYSIPRADNQLKAQAKLDSYLAVLAEKERQEYALGGRDAATQEGKMYRLLRASVTARLQGSMKIVRQEIVSLLHDMLKVKGPDADLTVSCAERIRKHCFEGIPAERKPLTKLEAAALYRRLQEVKEEDKPASSTTTTSTTSNKN